MNKEEGEKLTQLLKKYKSDILSHRNPYHMQKDHEIEYEIHQYINQLCGEYYVVGRDSGYDRGRMER